MKLQLSAAIAAFCLPTIIQGAAYRRDLKEDSSDDSCPEIEEEAPKPFMLNNNAQSNYLVGQLNYPNSNVPDILSNKTSGKDLNGLGGAPFNRIPNVGYSDMEPYFNGEDKVLREFFCLSAGGYGFSDNSADYALHIDRLKLERPFTFRAGGSQFPPFVPATNIETILIRDPEGHIEWENDAEIELAYRIPDMSWLPYKIGRVLTGRDFQPLGLAVKDQRCAVMSDGWVPSVFTIDPSTGIVKSNFVRIPEIINTNGTWRFTEKDDDQPKYISTVSDKVHCTDDEFFNNGGCPIADEETVEETDDDRYRKVPAGCGFSGLSYMKDNTVVGILGCLLFDLEYEKDSEDKITYSDSSSSKSSGDSTDSEESSDSSDDDDPPDEPGNRVYRIIPGDCTEDCELKVDEFLGFYEMEKNADRVTATSNFPDDDRKLIVIEQSTFPNNKMWPQSSMPADKLCVVDVTQRDPVDWRLKKTCILNFYSIGDPFDTGTSGKSVFSFSAFNKNAVVIVDDYCFITGTSTDFPFTDEWGLTSQDTEYYEELQDTRFIIVCFFEPVLDRGFPHFLSK